MKIAIVHDQLQEFGGAERVLVTLKKIFPEADVFTSFYSPEKLGIHAEKVKDWKIYTSWADKVPFLKHLYSPLRFITPWIWESFDFSKYDLVISSSGSYMCKGVKIKPSTFHICYLHHPPRYLYGYETAREWQKYLLIKIYGHFINHFIRQWDFISSQRPNFFIANSEETKRRIKKFYRRDAEVIYPPVFVPNVGDDQRALPAGRQVILGEYTRLAEARAKRVGSPLQKKTYYLTISRLARSKHIDILIKAANEAKFQLKIVGIGRDIKYLKSLAGPMVQFLGSVEDEKLKELYIGAKAFLCASVDEEFGIAPVEAMGYGIPVIAYKSGGVPETVKDSENGYLFEELTSKSLLENIKKLELLTPEKYTMMCKNARKTAERFSEEKFMKEIKKFVEYARASRS